MSVGVDCWQKWVCHGYRKAGCGQPVGVIYECRAIAMSGGDGLNLGSKTNAGEEVVRGVGQTYRGKCESSPRYHDQMNMPPLCIGGWALGVGMGLTDLYLAGGSCMDVLR